MYAGGVVRGACCGWLGTEAAPGALHGPGTGSRRDAHSAARAHRHLRHKQEKCEQCLGRESDGWSGTKEWDGGWARGRGVQRARKVAWESVHG